MAGVHAFDSDEKLSVLLEFVLVSENDFSEGSATAGVVHNILNDSLNVTVVEKGGDDTRMLDTPYLRSHLIAAFVTYPLRSAKSKVLKAAGATLFEVWALKMVLPPRLCTIVRQKKITISSLSLTIAISTGNERTLRE